MLLIKNNFSISKRNAFKVDVRAKTYITITSKKDFRRLGQYVNLNTNKIYILGAGFNTLFTKNFDGVIINPSIKGVTKIKESSNSVWYKVGAGEDWIKFVKFIVSRGFSGIENLNLIPGTIGAAPVQNIAAYGQNFEDVFVRLTAFDLHKNQFVVFNKKECKFAYRDSVFKREGKGRYIVVDVTLRLSKKSHIDTSYHSRYGGIIDELIKFATPPYTSTDIAMAVARIRRRKFPNWNKIGTAGSFFLNPFINKKKLAQIQQISPEVQFYPIEKTTYPPSDDPYFNHTDYVKVAAGWLLEEIGWKGKRKGNVWTSPNQSLVVVSNPGTNPDEIISFTKSMQKDFKKRYGIELHPEVNII